MLQTVGIGEGFGDSLAFVVACAGAERVDVAPVGFGLGAAERVAVDFCEMGPKWVRFCYFWEGSSLCLMESRMWMGFLPEVLASRILALHFFANSSAFLVPSKQVSRIPSGFSGKRLGLAGQARW